LRKKKKNNYAHRDMSVKKPPESPRSKKREKIIPKDLGIDFLMNRPGIRDRAPSVQGKKEKAGERVLL